MTYREFKDYVLQLIHQYSIAGAQIPATYNNQADFLTRIPALANDALVYLATTARRLRASAELVQCDSFGSWNVYELPDDFWQLRTGGLTGADAAGNAVRADRFRLLGERRIAVPAEPAAVWRAEYYRYPAELPAEPADTELLDCPPEAAYAAAFYAAAHLAMPDDPAAQAALYNEFETRLSRLGELPAAELGTVCGVYDWGDAE